MAELKDAPRPKTNGAAGTPAAIGGRAPAPPAATVPVTGSPFAFMRRFAEEMDHLFTDFGFSAGLRLPGSLTRGRELLRRESGLVPAEWSPRVDVLQREGQVLFRADLPGLSKDEVKVEVTDDTLTIQGERKHETKEQREGYFYNECTHGTFYRAIPIPEGVDTSRATAEFRNGVLEIAMPAPPRPQSKARQVEVR